MNTTHCPFCRRTQQGDYTAHNNGIASFEPLNPVTPGHRLFVPKRHAEHGTRFGAHALSAAMYTAATYAAECEQPFNLITSSGTAATQTILHLHVHYVPRQLNDGLELPWTAQQRAQSAISLDDKN